MKSDFQIRFTAGLLILLTTAAVILAAINLQKENSFKQPYDGLWCVEQNGKLTVVRIDPAGQGARNGIQVGDQITAINHRELKNLGSMMRMLYATGANFKVTYTVFRQGVSFDTSFVLADTDKSLYQWMRLIAAIYFGIGLYVLLRRWTAPGSTHFYIFCLVSFVLYSFHYTGKLNAFDWTIYWGNVLAGLLQPVLFLHFVLVFPEKLEVARKHRWTLPLLYGPAALLLAFRTYAFAYGQANENLRWNLDRLDLGHQAFFLIAAACVLWRNYRRASSPILRQQLKWVTRGTILAFAPYTLFYVIPYLSGSLPSVAMKLSVLSLGLLPLTFGYAIFRYRLMDVDLIFKRGMVYFLAAVAIVGLYFAVVAAIVELVRTHVPSFGSVGQILTIVVTALLFDPVRKWIQEYVDQFFYRTRYDYRRTLVEFGRELSAETDLGRMLDSVENRLSRTLLVDRLAIFLASGEPAQPFTLAKSFGISQTAGLDLSFLSTPRPEMEAGHLFFENTHLVPRESAGAQQTIARLDLNYYIPCRSQQRTIAFLGLGKTVQGDFLSSEDIALLETLAGYIGIAIQNARLYASLEQKVAEYEKLKDFNENIVESINVGVLAVDLEDRIESWNSQMEVMYALSRAQALGYSLSEVFPAAFMEEFLRVRQSPGIHNLYKFRLLTPAGETRVLNVAIAPLVSRKFNVIGRLIIMDDITQRVDLESQLSQADKLSSIGLLAAGVAHEVNTPLAVISSYAQMLSKQVQSDPRQSALLEKITRQTFRASEIVNNLLNFSRTSGTEFAEVDVNKVILDTLGLMEHQFKTSNIRVEDDLTSHLPAIQGNSGRLQQVFLNLFLNAKDAMAKGGTLRISTLNGDAVSVVVSDTGSGIAQEHIQRIYDPFFTTKTAVQEGQRKGTGLGLSVTYGIIQEHSGKIRVESRQGEGTTFYLDFPLTTKAVHV
jgi:PAS domain S-box-containing protein